MRLQHMMKKLTSIYAQHGVNLTQQTEVDSIDTQPLQRARTSLRNSERCIH